MRWFIVLLKLVFTLNMLCWYRRYFDLDEDGVISPLDEVINDVGERYTNW